jgi:hypothetical protein
MHLDFFSDLYKIGITSFTVQKTSFEVFDIFEIPCMQFILLLIDFGLFSLVYFNDIYIYITERFLPLVVYFKISTTSKRLHLHLAWNKKYTNHG